MDSTSLPPDWGRRLEQLNREIHTSLAQVRMHLQELEAAEKSVSTPRGVTGAAFADILRASLRDGAAGSAGADSSTP